MATTSKAAEVFYPESDGKPMAETTFHRDVMIEMIVGLKDWFADDPLAYVSGNEFLYFVEGQPRRVVSPDVWFVHGIDKTRLRRSYKTWEDEGKGPDFVLEVSSRSTRREDLNQKFQLYRDDLKVREYFLFDVLREYLKPPFQGYRLVEGEYRPIEPVDGRLPSEVLGLHLEADGYLLALYDPARGRRLLNRLEALQKEKKARLRREAAIRRKNAEIRGKDAAIQEKDAAIQEKDAALRRVEEENERLHRELEALRLGKKPKRK
jgi:Uma2 family endonuclease